MAPRSAGLQGSCGPPSTDHLVGPYPKALQGVGSEGGGDGDVGGVAPARDEDTPDARDVVSRVEGVPGAAQIGLEPACEVHRRRVPGPADVAKGAGAIPRGDVHAPAKRDGQVGEVAADALAFVEDLPGGLGGAGEFVAELDVLVNEVADRL